jgi:hypothetical protein
MLTGDSSIDSIEFQGEEPAAECDQRNVVVQFLAPVERSRSTGSPYGATPRQSTAFPITAARPVHPPSICWASDEPRRVLKRF